MVPISFTLEYNKQMLIEQTLVTWVEQTQVASVWKMSGIPKISFKRSVS